MALTVFNRNIRDEAHDKIREKGPSGVQAFAFAPSGGWVIVIDTPGVTYSWKLSPLPLRFLRE